MPNCERGARIVMLRCIDIVVVQPIRLINALLSTASCIRLTQGDKGYAVSHKTRLMLLWVLYLSCGRCCCTNEVFLLLLFQTPSPVNFGNSNGRSVAVSGKRGRRIAQLAVNQVMCYLKASVGSHSVAYVRVLFWHWLFCVALDSSCKTQARSKEKCLFNTHHARG